MILIPVMAGGVWWLAATDQLTLFSEGTGHFWILAASGLVTAIPLILFGAAAGRLPLSVMGMLQYLTPVIQFLIALLVFGEAMARQGRGSIINISSMASTQALSGVLGYSVAKAGIDNFTRWLATDVARQCGPGVRVNAVAPGFFLSTQNRDVLVNPDGTFTERAQKVIARTPMGRFGDPEELNGAILWLCGDASSFVTGVIIPVDGGFSAFSGV